MNTLSHYYHFVKKPDSKSRCDLKYHGSIAPGQHEPLHQAGRHNDVFIYLGTGDRIKSKIGRKPQFAISNRLGHISGIYIPDMEYINKGFGDWGNDALLFEMVHCRKSLKIYVAPDKKNFEQQLFQMWIDGELDSEIDLLEKGEEEENQAIR